MTTLEESAQHVCHTLWLGLAVHVLLMERHAYRLAPYMMMYMHLFRVDFHTIDVDRGDFCSDFYVD